MIRTEQTCMTYNIVVCTVKNSWWWTEELSETCRVLFQNTLEKLVYLVGFIISNYWLLLIPITRPHVSTGILAIFTPVQYTKQKLQQQFHFIVRSRCECFVQNMANPPCDIKLLHQKTDKPSVWYQTVTPKHGQTLCVISNCYTKTLTNPLCDIKLLHQNTENPLCDIKLLHQNTENPVLYQTVTPHSAVLKWIAPS